MTKDVIEGVPGGDDGRFRSRSGGDDQKNTRERHEIWKEETQEGGSAFDKRAGHVSAHSLG